MYIHLSRIIIEYFLQLLTAHCALICIAAKQCKNVKVSYVIAMECAFISI